jgi:hypothetical protein
MYSDCIYHDGAFYAMNLQGGIHRYTIEGSCATRNVIFKDTLPYTPPPAGHGRLSSHRRQQSPTSPLPELAAGILATARTAAARSTSSSFSLFPYSRSISVWMEESRRRGCRLSTACLPVPGVQRLLPAVRLPVAEARRPPFFDVAPCDGGPAAGVLRRGSHWWSPAACPVSTSGLDLRRRGSSRLQDPPDARWPWKGTV